MWECCKRPREKSTVCTITMGIMLLVVWAAHGNGSPLDSQQIGQPPPSQQPDHSEKVASPDASPRQSLEKNPVLPAQEPNKNSLCSSDKPGPLSTKEQEEAKAEEMPTEGSDCTSGAVCGEVWLLSTQEVPWGATAEEAAEWIGYWRWKSPDQWETVDRAGLWDHIASPLPTVIYIHGNRTDPATAIEQAWTIYRAVCARAGDQKFRLFIWSWPSERIPGRQLPDLRLKADRSDEEAYHLAWHLKRMSQERPITLVGYSFGARVITGALHLLGGGCVAGRSLPVSESSSGRRFRVVLVAAAIGNDWILPGRRHARALSQMEQMLVTKNWSDPALRWYPRLERRDSPALGRTGPVLLHCLQEVPKIESLSVACWVGKQHYWRLYLTVPELQARLPEYLFSTKP